MNVFEFCQSRYLSTVLKNCFRVWKSLFLVSDERLQSAFMPFLIIVNSYQFKFYDSSLDKLRVSHNRKKKINIKFRFRKLNDTTAAKVRGNTRKTKNKEEKTKFTKNWKQQSKLAEKDTKYRTPGKKHKQCIKDKALTSKSTENYKKKRWKCIIPKPKSSQCWTIVFSDWEDLAILE